MEADSRATLEQHLGGDVVGAECNITADEGLKKKILEKGEGWLRPEAGDSVTVHYTGTLLDGTKFDSSRDRDEPFTFTLKEGSVIKGWDLGVGTMKKGEKAILTCSPDYAYGARGSPPTIPPNSTLNFEVELLSWKSMKDILGDGGVIKTVVQEGTGWDKPNDRDEVLVKYSARVSGQPGAQPFASSPPEGSEFVVLQGLEGMNGVGRAVKTMKEGERVSLVIQPQYAYGALGRDGMVPPNAAVDVDLELVSWKRVEDVAGDGAVSKKVIKSGSDWKTPNEGATVTLRGSGRLEDCTVFDDWPQGEELVYVTDEELVCEGLDLAVRKMKKGERSEITIRPPFSYLQGHTGKKAQVPPNALLVYDVELVDFVSAKESYEMSNEEKVVAGETLKEKGNKAYKEGKLERAVRLYDKALSCVSYDKNFPEALRVKSSVVKKGASLNLAAVNLKLKDYKEAIKNCGKALEVEPSNTKAMYRRAQSHMCLADYVEAELDVTRALLLAPQDPDLLNLQRRLRVVMREESQKQKAMFSKMFSKPLFKDEPSPPPAEAVKGEDMMEDDTLPPGTEAVP